MQIGLTTTNFSKSKIMQMEYIPIPRNPNAVVLGWVNMGKKKWVIVKHINTFARTEYLTKVTENKHESNEGSTIICETHNGKKIAFVVEEHDSEHLELYEYLKGFKRRTRIAGQIYY